MRPNNNANFDQAIFESGLQEWVYQTPDDSVEDRALAAVRILECKNTRAKSLDLSDLGLTTLPAEIENLKLLQSLDLSNNRFGAEEITALKTALQDNINLHYLIGIEGEEFTETLVRNYNLTAICEKIRDKLSGRPAQFLEHEQQFITNEEQPENCVQVLACLLSYERQERIQGTLIALQADPECSKIFFTAAFLPEIFTRYLPEEKTALIVPELQELVIEALEEFDIPEEDKIADYDKSEFSGVESKVPENPQDSETANLSENQKSEEIAAAEDTTKPQTEITPREGSLNIASVANNNSVDPNQQGTEGNSR